MARGKLPPDLAALVRTIEHPESGFFGPRSISWRIAKERVLYAGGPRALLLQLAHPHVAQGVAEHSQFREDPIGRSLRTFGTVYQILFGSMDTALEAALRTRHIHSGVKGSLPVQSGGHSAGSHYHANRGDLLFWVHATLVDSALDSYQRFVRPLSAAELDEYYQESKTFAKLFGAQDDVIPHDYQAFVRYVDGMVNNTLAVSPAARELCSALMWGPPMFRMFAPANFLLAGGMLPPKIREQYGLPWNLPMRVAFRQFERRLAAVWPRLPEPVRELSAHRKARKRISAGYAAGARIPARS